MGYAIPKQVVLETEECSNCGVPFAMPDYMMRRLKTSGESFYCPNGHGMHYRKTEVQRLREKLDEQTRATTRMIERARVAEVAEKKALAEMKRMAKRASAGVCPCCNRTFQQLARHMKMKHPDHGA